MPHVLHLLVVDRSHRAALAAWRGTRWLLPALTCPERARVDSLIVRCFEERGLRGDIAGRWLGRLTPSQDSMDWLVAIDALPGSRATNSGLSWTPLDTLASGTSLLDYQQWAVAATLQQNGLPSVRGPFGNLTWPGEVRDWVGEVVGEPRVGPVTPYRVTSHEVVLSAETKRGRVYFKGLTADRTAEPRLTRVLSGLEPRAFARTLALEERPDDAVWWLAAECPGKTLATRPDAGAAAIVARDLARVQRRVMASAQVLGELQEVDLPSAAVWSAGLLSDRACRAAVERACDEVRCADVPRSWIPLDLDPVNVLVDDDGRISFIDVDDSFLGPAPLAMAMFARRCHDDSACHSYREAWSPPLKEVSWPAFNLAAVVVEAWLGWKRVEKSTDRGEAHGVLDVATTRLAQRLVRAVYRR